MSSQACSIERMVFRRNRCLAADEWTCDPRSSSLTTTSRCASPWRGSSGRRLATRNLRVGRRVPGPAIPRDAMLRRPRPGSPRAQRSRAADATRRTQGHADHLHHRPRRRADDRPGDESRCGRVLDQAIQRRRAAGSDPAAPSSAARPRSREARTSGGSGIATRRSPSANVR